MADIVDKATRSRMMSGIRGKDTKPELAVRSFLHRAGLRFRLHAKLPGKPDLVLPKYRTAVFVHGCFWHRHENCRYATTPQSNSDFWDQKFIENVERDRRVQEKITGYGFSYLVIWECEINPERLSSLVDQIKANLHD